MQDILAELAELRRLIENIVRYGTIAEINYEEKRVRVHTGGDDEDILAIIMAIALAAFLIYKYWEPIKAFFSNLWSGIIALFTSLPGRFAEFGAMIVQGLINGITKAGNLLLDKVKSFAVSITETFQASMGIHSPSRLFASYGGYLTDGLAIGIDRGQVEPIRKVKGLTTQLGNIASDNRTRLYADIGFSHAPGKESLQTNLTVLCSTMDHIASSVEEARNAATDILDFVFKK
ncbi:hypothetical protein NB640_11375 [Oxalobacter vibrioformis]|uniref:Uncharacterized protein n=1 Tax=Oxalobacter vibrioformis TaxID=933080 RepID=A0A9E9LX18_9BURK|nr:hypothetical protein [Oxalobacter vibrioformis]WAW09806.1 hypothetical protein NB640_11375 [Oxalobacter vibrioformis]